MENNASNRSTRQNTPIPVVIFLVLFSTVQLPPFFLFRLCLAFEVTQPRKLSDRHQLIMKNFQLLDDKVCLLRHIRTNLIYINPQLLSFWKVVASRVGGLKELSWRLEAGGGAMLSERSCWVGEAVDDWSSWRKVLLRHQKNSSGLCCWHECFERV